MKELTRYQPHEIGPVDERVSWDRAVATFLDVRAGSPHTRRAYICDLDHVRQALGVLYVCDVMPAALAEYAARHLRDADGSTRSSQARRMSTIRSFLRWCSRPSVGLWPFGRDYLDDCMEPKAAAVRRPYPVLTDAEVEKVLTETQDVRKKAVFGTLISGAFRVGELAKMRIEDISPEDDGWALVHVPMAKGGKSRTVPLEPDAVRLLVQHLHKSNKTLRDRGPVFPGPSGDQLSTYRLWTILTDTISDAGLPKHISPHACRHTAARRAHDAGMSLPELQEYLGHASPSTTVRYLRHSKITALKAKMPRLQAVAV